jgi:hypothetical protein
MVRRKKRKKRDRAAAGGGEEDLEVEREISSPTFEDLGTINSIAIFHRRDIRNIEIDEKEKTITWFFRTGTEVEVNGKILVVNDDHRAQIAKRYSNNEDFHTVRVAIQEFDKMEEAEFRIHNSKNMFFSEKKGRGG